MRDILLSLKHRHCENILSGEKTSELRTRSPRQVTPYRAFLYDGLTDGGCGKVVGECDVYDDVEWRMFVGIPSHLSKVACISKEEIWEYCEHGKKEIHELRLKDVVKYDEPKELSDFVHCKKSCEDCPPLYFHSGCYKAGVKRLTRPPQSWCYVEEM